MDFDQYLRVRALRSLARTPRYRAPATTFPVAVAARWRTGEGRGLQSLSPYNSYHGFPEVGVPRPRGALQY